MITRDTIKAIPANYNGVVFRSKMEMRFAKLLDKYSQKWIYEPEGLTDGKTCYLPDFYLPNSKMIVEVKPLFFIKESCKMDILLNNELFDRYALAVIEANHNSINVLKYSPPYYYGGEEELKRYWEDPREIERVGLCDKCNSFNINHMAASWNCTGCGYYDGDCTIVAIKEFSHA